MHASELGVSRNLADASVRSADQLSVRLLVDHEELGLLEVQDYMQVLTLSGVKMQVLALLVLL